MPGRRFRAAHAKRINAPPQTLHTTVSECPARTGPTHHPPTHSRTHRTCRRRQRQPPTLISPPPTPPEPIGVQQHQRCRSYNDTTVHGEALQVCNNKITQNRPSGIAIAAPVRARLLLLPAAAGGRRGHVYSSTRTGWRAGRVATGLPVYRRGAPLWSVEQAALLHYPHFNGRPPQTPLHDIHAPRSTKWSFLLHTWSSTEGTD